MRLFVAVEVEEGLKEKIREVEESVRKTGADVKLVESENLHVTLKFLGEVPEEKVREVEEAVSKSVAGVGVFKMSIDGFGYFGSPRYIRTLWLDVKEGKEKILEIMSRLNENLNSVRNEKRESNVHITVGRVKSARNRETLLKEIEKLSDVKIGEMDVKEIKLKSSVLTEKGPVYSDVKVFGLE